MPKSFFINKMFIYLYSDNNNIKTHIMKTFLSKQKYQVYAVGIIAVYFLTRFFY